MFGLFNAIGETLPTMALARQAVTLAKGRSQDAVRPRPTSVADQLVGMVQPFAESAFAAHRAAGRPIVLATTTPYDLVKPFADRLGLDDVVATRYTVDSDGRYDGTLAGPFVWSAGQARRGHRVGRRSTASTSPTSYAYSDSVYDTPLLAAVGHPVVVNPDARMVLIAATRRWPTLNLDVSPGVVKIPVIGLEVQQLAHALRPTGGVPVRPLRHRRRREHPAVRAGDPRRQPPQLLRRRGDVDGHRQERSHRLASSARRRCSTRRSSARSPRRWAASGSTAGTGSNEPLQAAADALGRRRDGRRSCRRARSLVVRRSSRKPKGRWGAARLAQMTGAPIIPVGMWGTEKVWPRSSPAARTC